MKVVKASTSLGRKLIVTGGNFDGVHLKDIYTTWSNEKEKAWNRCYELYLDSEEHEAFSIISHNTFGFSVSWLCKQGLRIETPKNSYLVLLEE